MTPSELGEAGKLEVLVNTLAKRSKARTEHDSPRQRVESPQKGPDAPAGALGRVDGRPACVPSYARESAPWRLMEYTGSSWLESIR